MVRPTDWKMMAIEMMVFYSSQKDGSHRGHTVKPQGWSRPRGNLRKTQGKDFIVVSVRRNKKDRASRLRIS